MALPTPDNLKSMDWAYQAQPFVDVPAKFSIDLNTMDLAYLAQPFVRNPFLIEGLPITIDNVQVKSITIDGQVVTGLTIDGETIF